jgi:hypothetical protein
MASFFGRGKGNAVGAPLEAVVQDLCDTRSHLTRVHTAVEKMQAATELMKASADTHGDVLQQMLVVLGEIRDAVRDLKTASDDGIAEARTFRLHLAESTNAVRENTNERRAQRST